eukprot:SAG31_NODE_1330_length_8749_cov_23.618844_7_plen_42_part_00
MRRGPEQYKLSFHFRSKYGLRNALRYKLIKNRTVWALTKTS